MLLNTIKSPVLKRASCDKNGFEVDGNTVPTAGGESFVCCVMKSLSCRADRTEFQIHKELWQRDPSSGRVILPGFQGTIYA